MRLTKAQKYMLRSFGKHTTGIGFIDWTAAPLVKAKYLRPDFIFAGETYYAITKAGKAVLKPSK